MLIGVPSEIKAQELRVGLTPESVQQLVNHGHQVLVENQAGYGAGFENSDYENVGAKILKEASDIFHDADLIINGFIGFDNKIFYNKFNIKCCLGPKYQILN